MEKKSIKINSILNVIKQLCSVIFPLITFPYITRIIGSSNYGKINFSASIVSYFTLLAALGISNYAIREGARKRDNRKDFEEFASQVFTINVLTTIISYALFFISYLFWAKLHDYTALLIIQGTAIIFTTLGCDWVNTIYEDYRYITIRYIGVQLLSIIAMFVFVHTEGDYVIYAIITVMSSVGANILNLYYIRRYAKIKLLFRKVGFNIHLLSMLVLFGSSVAATIYTSSDTTLLGVLLDDRTVGIYSFSSRLYLIVKQVINASYVVIIPRVSNYLGNENSKSYNELLKETLLATFTITLPASVGLFMVSPQIVALIGGSDFLAATGSLRILAFSLLFSVLGYLYTSCVLIPNRKEKACLIIAIASAVLNLGLNFLAIPMWGAEGAALTTLLAELFVFILSVYYARNCHRRLISMGTIIKVIIPSLFVVACCFLSQFIQNNIFSLIVSIISSGVFFMLVSIICKNQFVLDLLNKTWKRLRH